MHPSRSLSQSTTDLNYQRDRLLPRDTSPKSRPITEALVSPDPRSGWPAILDQNLSMALARSAWLSTLFACLRPTLETAVEWLRPGRPAKQYCEIWECNTRASSRWSWRAHPGRIDWTARVSPRQKTFARSTVAIASTSQFSYSGSLGSHKHQATLQGRLGANDCGCWIFILLWA